MQVIYPRLFAVLALFAAVATFAKWALLKAYVAVLAVLAIRKLCNAAVKTADPGTADSKKEE